ncbi:hypothetical protein BA894_08960 [Vibrio natriegens]|nr:hypothetical protein BA894_08960 [Vibrio natriegens]
MASQIVTQLRNKAYFLDMTGFHSELIAARILLLILNTAYMGRYLPLPIDGWPTLYRYDGSDDDQKLSVISHLVVFKLSFDVKISFHKVC